MFSGVRGRSPVARPGTRCGPGFDKTVNSRRCDTSICRSASMRMIASSTLAWSRTPLTKMRAKRSIFSSSRERAAASTLRASISKVRGFAVASANSWSMRVPELVSASSAKRWMRSRRCCHSRLTAPTASSVTEPATAPTGTAATVSAGSPSAAPAIEHNAATAGPTVLPDARLAIADTRRVTWPMSIVCNTCNLTEHSDMRVAEVAGGACRCRLPPGHAGGTRPPRDK